jgi:MFS family permease
MRVGLAGIAIGALLLPLPDVIWLLVVFALAAAAMVGSIFAPAMALLSDSAERAGVPQGYAFGFMNLAWAGGQVGGAVFGARLADATADGVPYAVTAVLATVTLAALLYSSTPRASRAASSAARS